MFKTMQPRRAPGAGRAALKSHLINPVYPNQSLCGLVPLLGFSDRVDAGAASCAKCARIAAETKAEAEARAFDRIHAGGNEIFAILSRRENLDRLQEIRTHSLFHLRQAVRGRAIEARFHGLGHPDPEYPVTLAGVRVRQCPDVPLGVILGLSSARDACGKLRILWAGGLTPQGCRVAPLFAERRRRAEVNELERQARAENPSADVVATLRPRGLIEEVFG